MRREAELLELVAAVVDGTPPTWSALESQSFNDEERRFIRSLEVIADVSEVHRASGIDAEASSPGLDSTASPRRWGRFELIDWVGEGSFADVYRARDPLLNRIVAVKLLKQAIVSKGTLVERVLREGQALAALDHPNIIKVYEAAVHEGRAGLCMEYVHGRTLQDQLDTDGPFGADEAALIGQQICRALAQVHLSGLVHCDVKPRNVMRAQGGRVVLMDFGAGLLQDAALAENAQVTGTPIYMAPEVLAGAPSTPQADVYSVGVLLFHLVTRTYPFTAKSHTELQDAHRRDVRQNLHDLRSDLPDGFVRVLDRALATDPAKRFVSAGAMLSALTEALGIIEPARNSEKERRWSFGSIAAGILGVAVTLAIALTLWLRPSPDNIAPPSSDGLRVAVLPLRNIGDQDARVPDWRVDAVTDDLMTSLGTLPGARVSGWTSVNAVSQSAGVSEIAKTLGVDWIVEGSVRRPAETSLDAVVTLRLIEASTGTPVWATTMTRAATELFNVGRDTLPAIAAKLGTANSNTARARTSHSENREARDSYLQARYLLRNISPTSLKEARAHLERAIALDPDYALAHSALARCLIDQEILGGIPQSEAGPLARQAIDRAIALDDTLSEPHTRLGDLKLYYEFDWAGAGAAYRRAVDLNPFDTTARIQFAKYLAAMGRVAESVDQARVAEDVDPISAATGNVAMMLYYARRYDESLAAFGRRLAAAPGLSQVHFSIGRVYAAKGNFNEALRELNLAVEAGGPMPNALDLAEVARTYAQAGDTVEANSRLAALELAHPSPAPSVAAYFAYVHAALGNKDRAFELLDTAVRRRAAVLMWAQVDPRLDGLRDDPRYATLLRQLKLVQ
jgi:TolB-like protein/tRNA A-37 threonylcarbamoyl transferase component Bud32/thioredoxin-like negative regulator of GroEL